MFLIYKMAMSRILQNVKNRMLFKNRSTNFILLASLFLLSILSFYIFNKHSLENLENKRTKEVPKANPLAPLGSGISTTIEAPIPT